MRDIFMRIYRELLGRRLIRLKSLIHQVLEQLLPMDKIRQG